MSNRIFKFTANTINGVIQEFPQQFQLRCDLIKPVGYETVRNYDANECIVAMNVFLIMYGGQLMGTKCYISFTNFMNALRGVCFTDYLLANDCILTLNGCKVRL